MSSTPPVQTILHLPDPNGLNANSSPKKNEGTSIHHKLDKPFSLDQSESYIFNQSSNDSDSDG